MTKIVGSFVLIVAACGSRAAPKATSAASMTDPIPMTETTEPAVATTPAEPVEPSKPVEPAETDPAKRKADLLVAERAAYEKAKPVFAKWCAKCHTKGGKMAAAKKLDHFDMTTYPFLGHHAMEIGKQVRKSLGIDGGKPSMPFDKKGAVTGNELALIAAWADAFDAAHDGGAHEGHKRDGHQHRH